MNDNLQYDRDDDTLVCVSLVQINSNFIKANIPLD